VGTTPERAGRAEDAASAGGPRDSVGGGSTADSGADLCGGVCGDDGCAVSRVERALCCSLHAS
jgi:hypothetical protein